VVRVDDRDSLSEGGVSVASEKSKSDPWAEYARWRHYGEAPKPALKARLQSAVAAAGVRAYLRLIASTCRFETEGDESFRMDGIRGRQAFIYLMWHNRISAFMAYAWTFANRQSDYRMFCLVSASQDGELLARPMRESGGHEIRGSSSRQAVEALKRAVRLARKGANIATVGDGPRGPRYKLKPGPLLMAKATGQPIVPVTWSCTRTLQMHRSWDQMMFPLPYTTIRMRFHEPVHVAPDLSDAEMDQANRELQAKMDDLTRWADSTTRMAVQIPKPRPGEVLKRRKS